VVADCFVENLVYLGDKNENLVKLLELVELRFSTSTTPAIAAIDDDMVLILLQRKSK